MTGNGREYEGLTADYMDLLAQLLHVQVQVRRFKSRADVVGALKTGKSTCWPPPTALKRRTPSC
nr:hypothetical protein [Pseudomonas sp. BIGb0427]